VNILRFHRSTLASTIQTTFSKVSTDLIPAAPLWLRDRLFTGSEGIETPSQSSLSLDRSTFSFDSVIVVSPTTSDDAPDTAPKAKKAKPALAPGDSLGSIIDIDNVEDPRGELLNKTTATADIDFFFNVIPPKKDQEKMYMECDSCV
jgi:hypothetical protein